MKLNHFFFWIIGAACMTTLIYINYSMNNNMFRQEEMTQKFDRNNDITLKKIGLIKKKNNELDEEHDNLLKKIEDHEKYHFHQLKHENLEQNKEKIIDIDHKINIINKIETNLNQGQVQTQSCLPVNALTRYWKQIRQSDLDWVSPYKNIGPKEKYVTFEWDRGGWNNIRMSMETIIVFAKATGRTLVIAPQTRMYLLNAEKGKKHGFDSFFSMDNVKASLDVITMEEFLRKEALKPGVNVSLPHANVKLKGVALNEYLRKIADEIPKWNTFGHYLVFPRDPKHSIDDMSHRDRRNMYHFRGSTKRREAVLYGNVLQNAKHIHFKVDGKNGYRLLTHFYTFLFFADQNVDHLLKRFVRDHIHYLEEIFCKAEIIIQDLNKLSGGSFSSMHIRRGDLQFKRVKLESQVLYHNINDIYIEGELLYIATDERDKNYFEPWSVKHELKFLDDYVELAELKNVNGNWFGMIDQIVASRGRVLALTWFSTFSGYIGRMRGYQAYGNDTTFYTTLPEKHDFQHHSWPGINYYAREWPAGWLNIDD